MYFKNKPNSEEMPLPISAYIPLQTIVDYKGFRCHIITTTYTKGSQQVLGYSPENEQYVSLLQSFPKTQSLVFEEMPSLFHADSRVYNYEDKIEDKCIFPCLRIFQGPERTLADFQIKDKNRQTRSVKNTFDSEAVYIPETGLLSPPEINFHYNPVLTFEQNMREYQVGRFKIKPEAKFAECTPFEKWAFEVASETRTNKRINLRLLLDQPFSDKYNIAAINVMVLANDELIDANLGIKHLFDLQLYKKPDVQALIELSNKVFFEKIPLLLAELREKPIEITNIYRLLRLMANYHIEERHLGAVAVNLQIPHIREIVIEYITAQSICKVMAFIFCSKHMKVIDYY